MPHVYILYIIISGEFVILCHKKISSDNLPTVYKCTIMIINGIIFPTTFYIYMPPPILPISLWNSKETQSLQGVYT